jgi:BASS family bile acid:Na+ symporter
MRGELTGIVIPFVVFVLMTIVGSEIVPADFRRVLGYRRAVLVGTVGQTILVPALAALIIGFVPIAPETAAAILVLALCPGGILSNFYCALAGKNVALSVTLTAVSSVVCVATIPVVGAGILALVAGSISASVPLDAIVTQLLLFLIVPIAIGLLFRRMFERAVLRAQRGLHLLGLVLILVVVLLSAWEDRDNLLQSLAATALPAAVFTSAALALGYGVAVLSGIADRAVIAIELSVRNIPIALLIGSALGQTAMLSFSLAYFLLHAPIVLGFALINRNFGHAVSFGR